MVRAMRKSAAARLALAAALLAAPAGPARANEAFRTCMDPDVSSATMVDFCKRAVEWGGLTRREQAAAWTNVGVGLSELGRHGDALSAYDRAVAADPRFAPAYQNRALARQKRGMVKGALEDFAAALKLDPRDAPTLVARGVFYLERGLPEEALKDLDRAVRFDRDSADAWYHRGRALLMLGETGKAAESFTRTLRLDPNDAAARLQRAAARAKSDPRRARADYDAAVRLAPNWAEAFAARGRFLDAQGDRAGADADFRRAFELGYQAEWLNRRIEAMGG